MSRSHSFIKSNLRTFQYPLSRFDFNHLGFLGGHGDLNRFVLRDWNLNFFVSDFFFFGRHSSFNSNVFLDNRSGHNFFVVDRVAVAFARQRK